MRVVEEFEEAGVREEVREEVREAGGEVGVVLLGLSVRCGEEVGEG
jgi:hypothetical protein